MGVAAIQPTVSASTDVSVLTSRRDTAGTVAEYCNLLRQASARGDRAEILRPCEFAQIPLRWATSRYPFPSDLVDLAATIMAVAFRGFDPTASIQRWLMIGPEGG